jgi:hypothetical protein
MKTFELVCSTDGVGVDYTQTIHADSEPNFWTQYFIAAEHGCDFFYCVEV